MSIQKRAKLVPWIAGFALMGIVALAALPGIAASNVQNKYYTIDVTGPAKASTSTTSFAAANGDRTFEVKLTNATPGSSNFQSVVINAPTNLVGETPQSIYVKDARILPSPDSNNGNGAGGVNASATLQWLDKNDVAQCVKPSTVSACPTLGSNAAGTNNGAMVQGKIYVQGIDPVKSGNNVHQFITFSIKLTTPALSGCEAVNTTPGWSAIPVNGTSLVGDQFVISTNNSGQTTQLSADCHLVFDPAPGDGAVDTDITGSGTTGPVVVKVVDGAGDPVPDAVGTISIVTEAGSAATLTGGASANISCSSGVCSVSFGHLQGTAIGTYSVHADSPEFGTSSSASFKLFEYGTCPGESETEGNATITNVGDTCVLFTATFDGRTLNIDKPTGEQVLLEVNVDAFDPEPAVYPVPGSYVSPPTPLHIGQWCNGNASDGFTVPSGESWCLETQSTIAYGKDATDGGADDWVGPYPTASDPNYGGQLMQVTEVWLLDGDATLQRK